MLYLSVCYPLPILLLPHLLSIHSRCLALFSIYIAVFMFPLRNTGCTEQFFPAQPLQIQLILVQLAFSIS